jgi:putative hydrolase of the HAD superfamily
MNTLHGILLDLDHTLYDYNGAHEHAMRAVARYCTTTLGITDTTFRDTFDQAKKIIKASLHGTAASHNRLLYFQTMLELLKLPVFPHARNLYHIFWDSFLEYITLRPGALEFLDAAQARGVKICMLTNLTAYIQHQKIEKLELAPYLTALVTSEEVGHEKPHEAMFERGLQKLGTTRTTTCVIGDDLKSDALGGANMGMRSFWLTTEKEELNHPLITRVESFKSLQKELKWNI